MIPYGVIWQYAGAGLLLLLLVWTLVYISRIRATKVERPNEAYIQALRGLLDGDLMEGARRLREAVSQDTDNIDAYVRLGDLMRRSGHARQALEIHTSLLQRRGLPRDTRMRVKESLYEDYKHMGEPFRAAEVLQELLSHDPMNKPFRRELMRLYEKRGMWQEAVDNKKRLVDASTEEGRRKVATYEANIGLGLLEKGNTEEAMRYLRSALKASRDCVPALLAMGDVSYSKGDIKEALSYWRKVIDASPRYAFLTLERIEKAYFDRGKFGETKELYKEFLSKNEENVPVHDALARIYVKMGENESALAEYRKALESDPEYLPARIGLAELNYSMGRDKEAVRGLLSVVKASNRDKKKYYCGSCGYRSRRFHWVCPRCGETETFTG